MLGNLEMTGSSAVPVAAMGIGATTKDTLDALSWRFCIIEPLVVVVVANAVTSGTVTVSTVS